MTTTDPRVPVKTGYAPVNGLGMYYRCTVRADRIDRPITYEQMADDTAALMQHLVVENADAVGYGIGGGVALQLAIRHPGMVRKLVVASASHGSNGMHPVAVEMFPSITPELFAGSPIAVRLAGRRRPRHRRTDVARPGGFRRRSPRARCRALQAPRRRGDGRFPGHAEAQLAVLPATSHFVPPGFGLLDRPDGLLQLIPPFHDISIPEED